MNKIMASRNSLQVPTLLIKNYLRKIKLFLTKFTKILDISPSTLFIDQSLCYLTNAFKVGTVVDHSSLNPKIEGLNPGSVREKTQYKEVIFKCLFAQKL